MTVLALHKLARQVLMDYTQNMEAEQGFNYTMYLPKANNSNTDMHEEKIKITLRSVLGLAIILTNIALLIFYRHKSKKADITLLILGNLTGSDIILGIMVLLRLALTSIGSRYQIEACILASQLTMAGCALSSLMSAWCIFLLSCQVCIV